MGRVFLTIIVPLLLPTALYIAWRVLAGKQINIPAAWIWLTVVGLIFASLTLVAVSVDFGEPKDGRYVPPHVSDGTVIPGRIESPHADEGTPH
jgi:predicted membrane-bound mannosyltransferase